MQAGVNKCQKLGQPGTPRPQHQAGLFQPRYFTHRPAQGEEFTQDRVCMATTLERVLGVVFGLDGSSASPKATIITNTLLVVAVTALATRVAVWYLAKPKAEDATASATKRQVGGGVVSLSDKDFGDEGETRRDACRAFVAGSIFFHDAREPDTPAVLLQKPDGLAPGVDASALEKQLDAMTALLRAHLGETSLPAKTVARLLPMLTVNPALSALSDTGELPMMLQNRFVIQLRRTEESDGGSGGGMSLHVVTLGFVGPPKPGGGPNHKSAPYVLVVASSDLLAAPPEASESRSYRIAYSVRKAKRTLIAEEAPEALAAPPLVV